MEWMVRRGDTSPTGWHFKDPDKTPHTYDGRPFKLHGKIRLDITFGDKTMNTPVYVKMDAPEEPLLLSEGIWGLCHITLVWAENSLKRPPVTRRPQHSCTLSALV